MAEGVKLIHSLEFHEYTHLDLQLNIMRPQILARPSKAKQSILKYLDILAIEHTRGRPVPILGEDIGIPLFCNIEKIKKTFPILWS